MAILLLNGFGAIFFARAAFNVLAIGPQEKWIVNNHSVASSRSPRYLACCLNLSIEALMARKCTLTGKRPNVANNVSHSNRKSKRRQLPNLQLRKIWWEEGSCYVRLKISTRAMRTIDKKGLGPFAMEMGLDLSKYLIAA
jgi:large subunit ribosomal protein L28